MLPVRTLEVGTHLPTEEMSASARELSALLNDQLILGESVRFKSQDDRGKDMVVTIEPGLAKLLAEVMEYLKDGNGVTFVPVSKHLTTQQAADILNVSRPYLIKILDAGELPFHKIGRHRRILAKHLFEYKRKRDVQRSGAMSDLLKDDGDLY